MYTDYMLSYHYIFRKETEDLFGPSQEWPPGNDQQTSRLMFSENDEKIYFYCSPSAR